MDLLQLNSIFEGKYTEELKKTDKTKTITIDDFNRFRELLSINEAFQNGLRFTESSSEYFEAYDLLNKVIPDEIKEDLFFTAKLGYFFDGIPSKVVYILQKAIRSYNTPNNAISSLDVRSLGKFLKKGSLPDGVTLKEIMENLIGSKFSLLTKYRKSVQFKESVEIYVPNTDRVLILPKEVAALVQSEEDLDSIEYVKNVGVCVHGIPIRTLGGKVGLTLNEYDLRECR